jgi:hypothetical protein
MNNNDRLPNVTPGEILREEFLKPMNISAYKLAKDINMPATSPHFSQKNNKEAHFDDKMLLHKHLVKERGASYEYRVYPRQNRISRI